MGLEASILISNNIVDVILFWNAEINDGSAGEVSSASCKLAVIVASTTLGGCEGGSQDCKIGRDHFEIQLALLGSHTGESWKVCFVWVPINLPELSRLPGAAASGKPGWGMWMGNDLGPKFLVPLDLCLWTQLVAITEQDEALCSILSLMATNLLQKKVNPDLPVEIKPSNRAQKLHEEKLKKQQLRSLGKRRREEEQRWHLEMRRVLRKGAAGGRSVPFACNSRSQVQSLPVTLENCAQLV